MKNIGGQAVIEGVMMRSPRAWTVAVRSPGKEILLQKNDLAELPKILKKPVLRGFVALVQALVIGIKALSFSAEKAAVDEKEKPSSFSMGIAVLISFVLGLGIFLFLPLYCTKLMGKAFEPINGNQMLFNLVDGLIRIIFSSYTSCLLIQAGTSEGFFNTTGQSIRQCMRTRPALNSLRRMLKATASFIPGAEPAFCLLS